MNSTQAEKITTEEQVGFRAGRGTTEQIFNLESSVRNISCTSFIDFKTAFDRVWHAVLWATTKKYSISTNLNSVIKNRYDKATSIDLFNSSI